MNETQEKLRTLATFTIMFEEIKDNYGIDILKYDSFEKFMIDFKEELDSFPSELVFLNKQ